MTRKRETLIDTRWIAVPGATKGPGYWLEYCSKDGDWYMDGIQPTEEDFLAQAPKGQGKRTDLDDCITDVKAGATTKQLWRDQTAVMIKFSGGMLAAKRASSRRRANFSWDGNWRSTPP